MFAHLQKLPLSYFQYNKIGDLMSRLTNDIHAVRELMGFGSLAIVDAVVVILFSLTLMITIDPWLTLWSMMAMPLIPVVVRFFGRHIFRWSRDTQDQLSVMSAYVLENFSGIRVVQAYAQEENQIRGFDAISSEYRRKTMWLATLWGIFWPLMQVHAGIAATIVLWLGGRQVLAGTMTLGEFVAFNGYLAMLTWPLMAIGYTANQYQRGTAALIAHRRSAGYADRRALRSPADLEPASGRARRHRIAQSDFRLWHRPSGGTAQYQSANSRRQGLRHHRRNRFGQEHAGESCCCGFMSRPTQSILIDGIDIKRMPLRQLEDAIGYVSQDIFLFSGSVRENILARRRERRVGAGRRGGAHRPIAAGDSSRSAPASRRSSASAACVCPAGRNSAPRWRGRSSRIRRF